MRRRSALLAVLLVGACAASPPARADQVAGRDKILCTAVQATFCVVDGDCEVGAPWSWNIPQFIEVDLAGKRLSTTKASGENRSTPILNLSRDKGLIFIQGVEAGRAFSFVIEEETGMLSAAVAREGITVGVFGACTPMGGAGQ